MRTVYIPLLAEEGWLRRAKRGADGVVRPEPSFSKLTTPALQPAAVAPPLLAEGNNILE